MGAKKEGRKGKTQKNSGSPKGKTKKVSREQAMAAQAHRARRKTHKADTAAITAIRRAVEAAGGQKGLAKAMIKAYLIRREEQLRLSTTPLMTVTEMQARIAEDENMFIANSGNLIRKDGENFELVGRANLDDYGTKRYVEERQSSAAAPTMTLRAMMRERDKNPDRIIISRKNNLLLVVGFGDDAFTHLIGRPDPKDQEFNSFNKAREEQGFYKPQRSECGRAEKPKKEEDIDGLLQAMSARRSSDDE